MREGFRGRPQEQIALPRGRVRRCRWGRWRRRWCAWSRRASSRARWARTASRDPRFDEKLERERRYGEVYRLVEESNGYLLQLEFPRTVPPSGIKEELGISDEMPDYDYDIALQNGFLVVKGKVTDPNVRKLASGVIGFPAGLHAEHQAAGTRRRLPPSLRRQDLEVALPKKV